MSVSRRNLLLAGATLPFIGACSGDGDDTGSGSGASLEGLEGDEMWRAAAEPFVADLQVMSSGGEHSEISKKITKTFGEIAGINTKWVSEPLESMYTKLVLDMTTKSGDTDIILINYPWMGSFVANEGLEPLESYLDNDSYPSVDTDMFIPSLMETYGTWDDGQIVGLPFIGDAMIFYYNKKHFEEAGLDPEQPPKDWDEVISFGQQLTRDGRSGYALMGGRQNQATSQFSAVLFALGQNFYDDGGRPQFDSPEGVEAMTIIAEGLAPISPDASKTWGFDEANAAFADEACSMQLQWPGALGWVLDPEAAAFGNVAFGPPPVRGPLGGWGIGINANSQNKEAAYLVINYMTSLEVQRQYLPEGYNITAQELFENPDVPEDKIPFLPEVGEALANGQSWPRTPETQDVFSLINKWMNAAVTGQASPEEAAQKLNDEATKLRDDLGLIE